MSGADEPEWIVDFRKVLESEKSAADKKKALSRIQRRENVGNLKRAAAIFELTFDKDILKKLAKNLDLFALVRFPLNPHFLLSFQTT